METNTILTAVIWAIIGGVAVYFFMKSRHSTALTTKDNLIADLKSDVERLKNYFDMKLKMIEVKVQSQPVQPVVVQAPATLPTEAKVDNIQMSADKVEVYNSREQTSTDSAAKAYGIDNDEVLGLKKDQ